MSSSSQEEQATEEAVKECLFEVGGQEFLLKPVSSMQICFDISYALVLVSLFIFISTLITRCILYVTIKLSLKH